MNATEVTRQASFLIALLGVACGLGCTRGVVTPTVDPYALICRYDNPDKGVDYLRLWRDLDINSRLFATGKDNTPITVDLFTLGQSGSNVWKMIRLKDVFGFDWQFLLFAHDNRGWAFAGQIDFASQPYVEPSHRLEGNTNGTARLVIRYVSAYGTGVYERKDVWYKLLREGIIKEKETEPEPEGDVATAAEP